MENSTLNFKKGIFDFFLKEERHSKQSQYDFHGVDSSKYFFYSNFSSIYSLSRMVDTAKEIGYEIKIINKAFYDNGQAYKGGIAVFVRRSEGNTWSTLYECNKALQNPDSFTVINTSLSCYGVSIVRKLARKNKVKVHIFKQLPNDKLTHQFGKLNIGQDLIVLKEDKQNLQAAADMMFKFNSKFCPVPEKNRKMWEKIKY